MVQRFKPFIPETSHVLYHLATSLHAHVVNGNKALAAATQGSYRADSIPCGSCDGYKYIKDLTHKILLDIQILLFWAIPMFPTKQSLSALTWCCSLAISSWAGFSHLVPDIWKSLPQHCWMSVWEEPPSALLKFFFPSHLPPLDLQIGPRRLLPLFWGNPGSPW